MAAAGLFRMQLSPEAREELALEVAARMGRLELLLSMLRRPDNQDSRPLPSRRKRLAGLQLPEPP